MALSLHSIKFKNLIQIVEIVTDINFAFSCCSWQDLSLEKEVKEFDKSGEELLEGFSIG